MMDRKNIQPNEVYRNKKTGALGVLFEGHDYGCLSSGEVGIVYSGDDQNPSTPSFLGTNPEDLEKLAMLPEESMLTENHIHEVCGVGKGEDCCRYLTFGNPEGFSCVRVLGSTSLAYAIDDRVRGKSMNAVAINCGGRYGNSERVAL